MAGYIEGVERQQATLFPERLDELVPGDALVRVIDGFVAQLDVEAAGFIRAPCLVLGPPGSGGRVIGPAICCGCFLGLPQRGAFQPGIGAGVLARSGGRLADAAAAAGFQNHSRFSQEQRRGDYVDLPVVRPLRPT